MSQGRADGALLLYTTFPEESVALDVGQALVEAQLASCVNVLPGMRSVYRWKGAVEHGREAVAIIKTRSGLQAAVAAALRERHPYETPIVLFIPAEGDAATLAWLAAATGGTP